MVAPAAGFFSPPFQPYYEADGITIYNGDCRRIVPWLPKADLLLTDPPYGIRVAPRGKVGGAPGARIASTRFRPVTWDDEPPPTWVLEMLIAHATWSVLWGGNYYRQLDRASCWLVWDKRNDKTSFADCELAWTNFKRAVRVFRWRWNGMLQEDMRNKEIRVHPTQKPVALMAWCIGWAKGARSVLDPFMGSGTTLIAAQRLGLRAVGIEQDESYCAAAVRRLQEDKEKNRAADPGTAEGFLEPVGGCLQRPRLGGGREGNPAERGAGGLGIRIPPARRQGGRLRPA